MKAVEVLGEFKGIEGVEKIKVRMLKEIKKTSNDIKIPVVVGEEVK